MYGDERSARVAVPTIGVPYPAIDQGTNNRPLSLVSRKQAISPLRNSTLNRPGVLSRPVM